MEQFGAYLEKTAKEHIKDNPDIQDALDQWDFNYDNWYDEVVNFLTSTLTPLEANDFKYMANTPYGTNFPHQVNARHSRRLSQFLNEMDNLKVITRRQETAIKSS
ncbi:MAG: hypothetical protein IIB14_11215 [Chloroflexi bacterium]|nr:hypothetical protein [Chloroflexota bacterium]